MEFLTTKHIFTEIKNIIENAKQYIYILTIISIEDDNVCLKELLSDAQKRNVEINFVIKSKSNKKPKVFETLKNVNLFANKNLHAKCYLNEETVIITSMNLHKDFYKVDQENNKKYEMGFIIQKSENEELFSQILDEARTIKQFSTKL